MATQQMFPSDGESLLAGGISDAEKMFKVINGKQGLKGTAELMKMMRDLSIEIKKNMMAARGEKGGDSKLGMGEMPKMTDMFSGKQKLAAGLMAAGSIGMGMMPDTMNAVTQRIAADTFAGVSGLNSRQVILRSNSAVGGGATSAMGPTMAAMGLYAGGGYTASSKTFKNVMPQIGGLSALTGGTNEQMAAGLAGINAMRFLRIGVQARDARGNLKPPNQIINDTFRFLYGNKNITVEQAAMVLNPGSKGYATISQIAGGDQNLMSIIQQGIIARAKKGKSIVANDLKGADNALNLLGVGSESPTRSNFRFQTSEARKLQATEKGLVGGFNTALDTTSAVNNGFSRLAEEADGLVNAFAGLRGFLQTLPGAGNTGGTISGVAGMASGALMNTAQMMMMGKILRGSGGFGGVAAAAEGSAAATGAAAAGSRGLLAKLFGAGGRFGKFAKFGGKALPILGALLSGVGGYQDQKAGKGFWGEFLKNTAIGAGTGGLFGGLPGAAIGALISGGGYALGRAGGALFGQGGDNCNHGNVGCSHGRGGDNGATMGLPGGNKATDGVQLQMPVPQGTPVTSGYGPRDNSKNPQISSYHRGIDYGVSVGTKVTAAANGVVTHVGTHRQYGYYIIIKHGAKSTLYGHLSKQLVKVGETVAAGQVIALSGGKKGAPGAGTSTGPHLHFEVRDNGGVGAQGRENPKGWFGRLISTFKKVVGKVGNAFRNLFGGNDSKNKEGVQDPRYGLNMSGNQSLSSLPLSQTLSSSLMTGAPMSYSSLQSEYSPNALRKGVKGSSGEEFFNAHTDAVSGDRVGMAGGSRAGLLKLLSNAGFRGKALETAFAVALAESGGRANAYNKDTKDYGLFQINMAGSLKSERLKKTWKTAGGDKFRIKNVNDLYNPVTNAKIAYHMTHGGENWSRWATFQKGTFTKYLDDAASIKQSTGIGGDNPTTAMSLPTETGTLSGGRSGGGHVAVSNHQNIQVAVDMKVNIANGSKAEMQKVASDLRKSIENEFRMKGLVSN